MFCCTVFASSESTINTPTIVNCYNSIVICVLEGIGCVSEHLLCTHNAAKKSKIIFSTSETVAIRGSGIFFLFKLIHQKSNVKSEKKQRFYNYSNR